MALVDELEALFVDIAEKLKGNERRTFMAQVAKLLGKGGQRRAERELNWNRGTIRKGMHGLESGIVCEDAFSVRDRKRAEEHLPNLLEDIEAIADEQSQIAPTFKTTRLYTRISAAEVRNQLILQKGYSSVPRKEDSRTATTTGQRKRVTVGWRFANAGRCRPLNIWHASKTGQTGRACGQSLWCVQSGVSMTGSTTLNRGRPKRGAQGASQPQIRGNGGAKSPHFA